MSAIRVRTITTHHDREHIYLDVTAEGLDVTLTLDTRQAESIAKWLLDEKRDCEGVKA